MSSPDAGPDAERRRWFYTPTDHGGLTLGAQARRSSGSRTSWSPAGCPPAGTSPSPWTVTKWSGPKGDTNAGLFGVSCTSAVRCIAVGAHGTGKTTAPAALAWGGSKWTLLKVPGAGTGKIATFEGVSCPVNGKCVATGEIGSIGTSKVAVLPLAGYWNGRTWKYGPMLPAAAA